MNWTVPCLQGPRTACLQVALQWGLAGRQEVSPCSLFWPEQVCRVMKGQAVFYTLRWIGEDGLTFLLTQ